MIILVASATVENTPTHTSLTRHGDLPNQPALIRIDLIPALKVRAKIRLSLRDTKRDSITQAVRRRETAGENSTPEV